MSQTERIDVVMDEIVEEVQQSTSQQSISVDVSSIFANVDQCKALLQQVPETFYFGTTVVGLTCMDIGDEYFAFGSDCGALFFFNRRINRPVTPLRTNYDEVVTCLKIFSGDTNSMMAAGHKSGSIVLIRFPGSKPSSKRKMEQITLADRHRGQCINCVEWSNDASKLFSADETGIIVVTHVDFDSHLFQNVFVCDERSSITSISYALSHLVVRSKERIAIIDVASATGDIKDISAALNIDSKKYCVCGIHLCEHISNPSLLVASPDAFIFRFDPLNGHLRAKDDFRDKIQAKLECSCSIADENVNECSPTNVLTQLYSIDNLYFIYFFKRHLVLLMIGEGSTDVVTVKCLEEVDLLTNCELIDFGVDRSTKPVALFALTSDKRVIRFSSAKAPDYLTVASEPVEEFGARTLISSLQKTTRLLPYAPTSAILQRLTSNSELHALTTLPIPLISNILRTANDTLYNNTYPSSHTENSSSSTAAVKIAAQIETEEVVSDNSASSANGMNGANDADSSTEQLNSSSTALQEQRQINGPSSESSSNDILIENQLISKGNAESVYDRGRNMTLNWAVSQPNRLLDNVNEMAKRVVDVVGGLGVQTENGTYIAPAVSPVSAAPSMASDNLPYEQVGILEEVTVRRTKKAPGKKKKLSYEMDDDADELLKKFDSLSSYTSEDVSSIGEETLRDIRKVLLDATNSSLSDVQSTSEQEEKHDETETKTTEYSTDASDEDIVSSREDAKMVSSSAERDTSPLVSDVQERSETNESKKVDSENTEEDLSQKNGEESQEICDSNESSSNAFEKLMKRALLNKSTRFTGTQESSEYFADETYDEGIIVNDRGDIWNEINLPYSCTSFSVTSQYVVICHAKKKKKPRYMQLPNVDKTQWIPMKNDAEMIQTNDEGTLVWRIHKGVAYSPLPNEASCSRPCSSAWMMAANEGGGIVECALTRETAWYTTKNGEVYVQLRLPEMGILSRCESAWSLECITASEVAVWALQSNTGRLVVRAGLKHCPLGLDWVEIDPEGPKRLLSICLYGQSGWAIDESRSLWFTNGVDFRSPFGTSGAWLQVCRPWDGAVDSSRLYALRPCVRVSSLGVFVCLSRRIYWACDKSPLSGHRLRRIVPMKLVINDTFETLSAGCVGAKNIDALTVCRNNEVFIYRLKNRNFCSLPAFPSCYGSTMVQLIALNASVYVLDSSGCIYMKRNLGDVTPFGSEWFVLNTGDCGSPIVSFAVTNVSIWVLTAEASVFMMSTEDGKNIDETSFGSSRKPEWIKVKTPLGGDVSFDQIRASCSGMYVWLFSSVAGRLWARNSVSKQSPTGRSWSESCEQSGLRDLAIGCKVVWSLTTNGQLYRLHGLAAGNPAGNYWKAVPIRMRAIAVDTREHLWGIDHEGRLVSHTVEIYPPKANCCLSAPTDTQIMSPDSLDSVDDFVSY